MLTHTPNKQANNLIFYGLLLFMIGLLIGLFVQNMVNPRMGLAAHLEGIMNGMFLILLGLIWKRLILSPAWQKAAYWLAFYGAFANLFAVLLAAVTGFGKMMPIAGGKAGTGVAEVMISFLLVSLALCMLTVCVIVLVGFYRHIQLASEE